MASVFTRLGLPFKQEKERFVVTPPSFRFDLEIEEDLIEEVARVHGFERIRGASAARGGDHAACARDARARCTRCASAWPRRDYREVINFSFVEPAWEADFAGEAEPDPPAQPDRQPAFGDAHQPHRLAGRRAAQATMQRKVPRIRVFEVGRVFLRDPRRPTGRSRWRGLRQPMRIARRGLRPGARRAVGGAERAVDFFDVKADLEALAAPLEPALRARARIRRCIPGARRGSCSTAQPAGWIGELHPHWLHEVRAAAAAGAVRARCRAAAAVLPLPQPRVPSRFPPVVRDIALVFDAETPVQAVLDAMRGRKTGHRALGARCSAFTAARACPQGQKALLSG